MSFRKRLLGTLWEKIKGINKRKKMYTDYNNSNNDKDGEEKKNIPLMIKRQWASKHSTSPKEKLELGKVLKVEIGESG